MNQSICCVPLTIIVIAAAANSGLAHTIYYAPPLVLSQGEVHDLAGTITTDGTLGFLTPDNIVDYRIEITGPRPFTFLPSDPGARVEISPGGALVATADSLTIVPGGPGDDKTLRILSNDNSSPDCTDCEQSVEWVRGGEPGPPAIPFSRRYDFKDFEDDAPNVFAARRGGAVWDGVVATVPEPGSALMAALALVGVVVLQRIRICEA